MLVPAIRAVSSSRLARLASPVPHEISRRSVLVLSNAFTTLAMGGYNADVSETAYWNRETSARETVSGRVCKSARILALSDPQDPDNENLYHGQLPDGATFVAAGTCLEDFDVDALKEDPPNVLFVSDPDARGPLVDLLKTFPSIEWVQSRSAGIDFMVSDGLTQFCAEHENLKVTNAKGMYSSTLAEYTMMACSYFAKDLPRLLEQKRAKDWNKYPIRELRGATLGVIGYGDIGRATAKLADAYGMKVLALRRNPKRSLYDPYCQKVYPMEQMNEVVGMSDYILVAAPLTPGTRGMVSADVLAHVKPGSVIINVGRGPIIDENALIEALQSGERLKGAALDVTTIEPLPEDSPIWDLDNALLSPHNMDMTETFMKESTDFFITENLPRFVRAIELLNPVNVAEGY